MHNHVFDFLYEINIFQHFSINDQTTFEHKSSNNFYRNLKKVVLKKSFQVFRSKKIKDNRKVKVLLKVIQRSYDKNPETQEVIDASMIEVCAEEGVSPEQVFFILLFLCSCLYHNDYSKEKSK